jgi:hypothetical protein
MPLRHELASTTIHNLLEALDEALKSEKLIRFEKIPEEPLLPTPSEIFPQMDFYLMEIELQMQKLYDVLSDKVKGAGIVEFSSLIKGMTRLEAVRTFILLLFLAHETKVGLWQNEDSDEIYITVGDLNIAEDRKPTG